MTDDRWQRLSALLDELFELDAGPRAARLAQIGDRDQALAAELARLLTADARLGALDTDAAHVAPTLMSGLAQFDAADAGSRSEGGRQVGQYRLVERVGSGGMGEVWRAERINDFEQVVAIKLMRPLLDSPHLRERFARERRILARLDHPNIARLLDGGVGDDGTPWFAMEFVRGTHLVRHAQDQALSVRARVGLLLQVCDAVAHAHTQLVVHRDLKPSNILVDADGRARVLDFGIARLLDDAADSQLTGTGVRVFSPAYAAPEQIRGEMVGTAADVFALGAVLYELLTGTVPHPGRTASHDRLVASVDGETAPRPSETLRRTNSAAGAAGARPSKSRGALDGDLDTIVATALQPDPARRYAGAAQLADDLRSWLDGRPISARPDTAGYRMRKFVARHRVAVGSAGAVLLALVVGLGLALWQGNIAREHAARADIEAQRAEREAAVARAVSDFVSRDMIEVANPYRSKADISLAEALIGAGERIDSRFAHDPRLAGVLHRQLADSLFLAGLQEQGLKHARRAVETLQASQPADDAELLRARVELGRILHMTKEYAGAIDQYQAALDALPARPDSRRLAPEVGIAGVWVDQVKEREAVEWLQALEPAVVALEEFSQLHIDLLNHRMRAQMQLDRFEDALVTARDLRARAERAFGPTDPRAIEWHRREAIVLTALNRFDEAVQLFEGTCAAMTETLGDEHPSPQECRLRQGVALFWQGRFDEAAPLIEAVAAYRERTLDRTDETLWTTWVWLARSHQRQGRLEDARVAFERARDVAAEVMGPDSSTALAFQQTYGMFLEQTGQGAEAERLRRELLARSQRALPAGHVNIAKHAWDLGETLASRRHDAEYVAFCAEWLPRWTEFFGAEDERVVDARNWLAQAQARLRDRP